MERMDANPSMEEEEDPVHSVDASDAVPEEVTLDSDDDDESEFEDEDIITLPQSPKGKGFGESTSSTSRICGLGRRPPTTRNKNSQPDVIDLTKEEEDYEGDDDDIMITDTIEPGQNHNNSIIVEEDVPELIEVDQVPVPNEEIAEGKKKQGNDYFKLGQYYQALGMYTAAIEAMPSEASYYGNRSACHMMLKKYKEALDDIKKSLQLDPGYEKGYLRQIRTTLALGNIKECEMAFETVARLGLKNVDAKSEHEKLQWLKRHSLDLEATKAKKDYRKLVFLASQALEVATADNDMKMIKADALLRIGRHSEAQEICTEVLHNDVRCPEALYTRALLFYYEDNADKSIQFARQGLAFAPDNSSLQNMFKKLKLVKELRDGGATKFSSMRYDDAKNDYSRCLSLVSEGGDMNNITLQSKLYFNLALIAHKLNKLDESLQACGKAIELNSKYLKAIIHRAKIYNQKEMYDDAVHDFEAALRIDPSLKHLRREMQDAKTAAKRAKRKDYYKILNIEKNATDDEIRKAYKKRALVHHPDRHANATEAVQKEQERLFKDLGEAYEVLSDQKKRFRYDQGVDLMDDGGGFNNAYDPNNDFINVFFGNGGIPSFRPGQGQGAGGARGPHQFHHTFRH